MKKFTLALLAATALAGATPALAQSWEGINARQANLDRRIDQGVRNGSLTAAEAARLRAEFRDLAALEQTYRRSGGVLSTFERQDLDRRFDLLSQRIRDERSDRDDRGWQSINARQANLDRRIDQGVRNGSLTRAEAARLRAEFQDIVRLEAQYRRSGNGLNQVERQDLDRRFDLLSRRIRDERSDNDDRGWQSINARQANLDRRIDQGVRNGSLSPAEAARLRAEFETIVRLEAQYRRSGGGLNQAERRDLDQRFDALSRRIRDERRDNDGWYGESGRLAELGRRIEAGARSGQLDRAEAARLRAEYQYLVQLESNYRRNGLTAQERAELNRRFDVLATRIRWERRDWDRR